MARPRPATRYRNHGQTRNAYVAYQAITDGTFPDAWRTNGTLDEHQVLQLWYPDAHVYGIAVVSNEKALAKIKKDAEIVQVRHAPNKYAGLLIKHAPQATRAGHRCIAPAPWSRSGGPRPGGRTAPPAACRHLRAGCSHRPAHTV